MSGEAIERVWERYQAKSSIVSLSDEGTMTNEGIAPGEPEGAGGAWGEYLQRRAGGAVSLQRHVGNDDESTRDWDSSWKESEEWSWEDSSWSRTKVYVGNLPAEVTEVALYDVFLPYGDLYDVRVIGKPGWEAGRRRGTRRCCALIVYASSDGAERCLAQLSGYEFQKGLGPLIIRYADKQPQRGWGSNEGRGKVEGKGKRRTG
jgi:hypothetical protein